MNGLSGAHSTELLLNSKGGVPIFEIAARIATLAEGGQILVSSTFRDLTANAGDLSFSFKGEKPLKGLAGMHPISTPSRPCAGERVVTPDERQSLMVYQIRWIRASKTGSAETIEGPGGKAARLFDSTAILIYLAEKTRKFLGSPEDRPELLSWLLFIASGLGPFSGQAVHFQFAAPEGLDYAVNRYRLHYRSAGH